MIVLIELVVPVSVVMSESEQMKEQLLKSLEDHN